jgi:hypothetical protein
MASFSRVLGPAVALCLLLALPALAQDADGDGAPGSADNCPFWPNPLQGDADGNGIGDACECGDQNADRTVDVRDVLAINAAIFDPSRRTALCDTDFDGDCDVLDLVGARRKLFGAPAYCGRNPPPGVGQSAFVSAPDEALTLPLSPGDPRMFAMAEDTTSAPQQQVVEEGDIYRVLPGGRILNLNAYRGLQVIDVNDVDRPRIIGGLRVSGSPVELYVVGTTAFVLLNNWRAYYGSRDDIEVRAHDGGLVLAVDLGDPTAPVEKDRAVIRGYIHGSRLTRAGARAALYAATGEAALSAEGSRTLVHSFEVSDGTLVPRATLDLGASTPSAVQATPEALLVARIDWASSTARSQVSIIDIRDPGGAMVAGGQVTADGMVQKQFNMDLYKGVLRVVSSYAGRNTVETWNVANLAQPVPVDRESFGANESLFATLFLGNKAFFVTFLRIDPFHAFAIDDSGAISQESEFEVSGWNDFFRAVAGETRLIGIGMDDQTTRSAAVSLYDITNLSNPSPLVSRAAVEAGSTWSEASFDHRAFSVLENAVDVPGPGGARERGLVLLPFSGWDGERYTSAVQIFTFSSDTLTRRGLMEHGSPVRRSFLAADSTTANLSEEKLGLYGLADPDQPERLGELELAPSYTRLFLYGSHAARVKNSSTYYYGWWGPRSELPDALVEIVPRDADPDQAQPVASFAIPSSAAVHQVGNLFVTLTQRLVDRTETYSYETQVDVYDLSAPTSPALVGSLTTDRLQPGYYVQPYCPMCLDALVFRPIFRAPISASVGVIPGGIAFLQTSYGQLTPTYTLDVLDLTRPASPLLAPAIELGADGSFGFSLLTDGSDAWLSFVRAAAVEGDARAYQQRFIQRYHLSNPSKPRADGPINVPGELIAIEGTSLYTRDTVWGKSIAETAIARLLLHSGLATLKAKHVFEDQFVENVLLDGAGQVLVSHRGQGVVYPYPEYAIRPGYPYYVSAQELSVLEALDLEVLANIEVDAYARLRHAQAGRALFEVSGGVLVFNLDEPTRPFPQAFFTTLGFPEQILVDAGRILIPAGRYGIYSFDLDASNLLPPEDPSGG